MFARSHLVFTSLAYGRRYTLHTKLKSTAKCELVSRYDPFFPPVLAIMTCNNYLDNILISNITVSNSIPAHWTRTIFIIDIRACCEHPDPESGFEARIPMVGHHHLLAAK